MDRARGSRIYDVDGNEYIDWMMSFGALPLGHAHPEVVEAITEEPPRPERTSPLQLRSNSKSPS